jgi:hypothetical protein
MAQLSTARKQYICCDYDHSLLFSGSSGYESSKGNAMPAIAIHLVHLNLRDAQSNSIRSKLFPARAGIP